MGKKKNQTAAYYLQKKTLKAIEVYRSKKFLTGVKQDPPMIQKGYGKAYYGPNPHLDFLGCLYGGMMFCLEVKHTKTMRLPINRPAGITKHQLEVMAYWKEFKALVGVLWENPEGYWFASTGIVFNAWAMEEPSIGAGDCSFVLPFLHDTGEQLPDFLNVLTENG